jgi:hypothetical protein
MSLNRAQFFKFLPKTCEGLQGSLSMLSICMPILDEKSSSAVGAVRFLALWYGLRRTTAAFPEAEESADR